MRGAPDCALDDEIVTIRPQRASSMSGTAACRQWNVPVRLMARMRSQLSIVMSVKDSNASRPALVTMICDGSELRAHLGEGGVDGSAVG